MPLTYDGIDGSWGAYSEAWPEIEYAEKYLRMVEIFCRDNIPYGCYVFISRGYRPIRLIGGRQMSRPVPRVRLETVELRQTVQQYIVMLEKDNAKI